LSWDELWNQVQTAFRKSPSLKSKPGSVAAWLRKGRIDSFELPTHPFEAEGFRKVLEEIRGLTRALPGDFAEQMVSLSIRVGVKVVFVPELPNTCAWGATRWLTQTSALIQLSLRYRTDDHFWFTFFHEAGHILLHGKRDVFVESDDGSKNVEEEEADAFARDFLIAPNKYSAFLRKRSMSCVAVERFAYEIGIAPGIVVGRLQHDRHLTRTSCNDLKRPLEFHERLVRRETV
jgi:HTH-type transcriptional regulator / antitoxin HigA